MLMVKVVGTLIILVLIAVLYFFFIKKEDRKNHRYVIPTAAGFGLAVLPNTFIHQEAVLSAISVLATCLVVLGMFWYVRQQRINKKAQQKKTTKKHR